MYLSRLTLNPRNKAVRREVTSPYELHRTLMRAIDHAPDEERLLFRIEPERGLGGPKVLVQTRLVEPQWAPLLANTYLLRADGPTRFQPTLDAGVKMRFRLTSNPVKKVEGKRIPLLHSHHDNPSMKTYWDWLQRQSERHGFRVLDAHDAPFRTGRRENDTKRYSKTKIPHFGVRFDGVLEVVDPVALSRAIEHGIGPAKAFGFGLLSVARAA